MDNKVYSAFFRELQPYTFSQIKESLGIDDYEQLKRLIRTLKAYNILKTVKSEKLDYENLSDQDCVFANVKPDSDSVVYVFKFVGIVLLRDTVIKCYPKYIDTCDQKIIEDSLILALKALERYNTNKIQELSLYNGDDFEKDFNKLELALFLLRDYFIHGLYSNQEEVIEINGEGEYLFDKTVEQNMAIMQDGLPYYVEIFTRRNREDDTDYFRQLHKCILNECSSDLKKTGLLDIFALTSIEFPESKLEYFGEKEYILNRISSELGNQFITHRQTLLKTLYTFIESEYGNETDLNLELLGTNSFNLVWEKACGAIFGNLLDAEIKNLVKEKKLPEIHNSKFDSNDKIIELIEKVRWEFNEKVLEATETLEPDVVTIDEKEKGFYILDGKYYLINIDDQMRIYNQPGIQDVVKQFAYQKAYQDFIKEYKFNIIANAFLFPQRYSVTQKKKHDILNIGTVNLDLMQFYAFKLLAPIQVLQLNPQFVFEKYITNTNCEKELFESVALRKQAEQKGFDEINLKERAEKSMLGFLRSEYFDQIIEKIQNEKIESFPFFFYAFGKNNEQYPIDSRAIDSKYFIGYGVGKDKVILGEIKSDLQFYGRGALGQILKNKNYKDYPFSVKSYFYYDIQNPKIISVSNLEKEGIKISGIKKNSIISGYAPKVLEN